MNSVLAAGWTPYSVARGAEGTAPPSPPTPDPTAGRLALIVHRDGGGHSPHRLRPIRPATRSTRCWRSWPRWFSSVRRPGESVSSQRSSAVPRRCCLAAPWFAGPATWPRARWRSVHWRFGPLVQRYAITAEVFARVLLRERRSRARDEGSAGRGTWKVWGHFGAPHV